MSSEKLNPDSSTVPSLCPELCSTSVVTIVPQKSHVLFSFIQGSTGGIWKEMVAHLRMRLQDDNKLYKANWTKRRGLPSRWVQRERHLSWSCLRNYQALPFKFVPVNTTTIIPNHSHFLIHHSATKPPPHKENQRNAWLHLAHIDCFNAIRCLQSMASSEKCNTPKHCWLYKISVNGFVSQCHCVPIRGKFPFIHLTSHQKAQSISHLSRKWTCFLLPELPRHIISIHCSHTSVWKHDSQYKQEV